MVKKEKEPQVYKPKPGDRIICEHKGLKYEARVIDARRDSESTDKNIKMEYLVHYQGWNKSWDEWVSENRVFQYNETNLAALKEQRASSTKSKGSSSARKKLSAQQQQTPTTQHPSNTSTISSQGSVSESIIIEPEEPLLSDKEIRIKITEDIKSWLIDDDNNIKNKKLTVLPAKPTISTILKDFVTYKKNTAKQQAGDKEVVVNELTLGIKDYFNVMLGAHLLYKFERLQYQLLLKEHGKDIDLTNHYGVIHLVRLITKIGKPLASTVLDSQSIQTIVNYIQDLLRFLSKQANLFDLDKNYTIAPPDYIKNALK